MPYAAKAKTQQFTRRKSNLVKNHTSWHDCVTRTLRWSSAKMAGITHIYRPIIHNGLPRWRRLYVQTEHKTLMRWLDFRRNRTLCQSIYFLKTLTTVTMTANQSRRRRHRKQCLSQRVQGLRRRSRRGVNLYCSPSPKSCGFISCPFRFVLSIIRWLASQNKECHNEWLYPVNRTWLQTWGLGASLLYNQGRDTSRT